MIRFLTRCLLFFLFTGYAYTAHAADYEVLQGEVLPFAYDNEEAPVVHSAIRILQDDLKRVLSVSPQRVEKDAARLVVGTLANSRVLPQRIRRWKDLQHKEQSFIMEVSPQGVLYIIGSDSHGTAYGVMELCRLIGVSPWEWWADVYPKKKTYFMLEEGFRLQQSPSVTYRGIFINDEDWGLLPWSNTNYEPSDIKGHIGPRTHERIFELLLRLRANTFWPAMHECTLPFFMTEGNREMAARYGIYIGTSHCEPMACNAAGEWSRRGEGEYDYVNNADKVYRFWEERVKDVAQQPVLYTLGMRGVHDGKMQGAKSIDEQKNVLMRVIDEQRQLLCTYVNKEINQIPQVFIPYKEVLDIYNAGLKVPDDVTLMWCDDNYGYIRHFPTDEERARKGGNGVYYHVSYWGRPHDYLWLCTVSPYLIHQQMSTAYNRGIRKMWVLNVGDLKPAEYQIELFMDMAWDMERVNRIGVTGHLREFMTREFGGDVAERAMPLLLDHYHWAYRRKPEFMGGTRTEERDAVWTKVHELPLSPSEIKERWSAYQSLSDGVEYLSRQVPQNRKTAFYHLVKYPIQGAAQMNFKFLAAQQSIHENVAIEKSHDAHDSILSLTRLYNDDKWKGIMDWRPRRLPVFNKVTENPLPCDVSEYVGIPLYVSDAAATETKPIMVWNELGYSRKAVELEKFKPVHYTFEFNEVQDAVLRLQFVPTHPIEGEKLRVAVKVDNLPEQIVSYETKGRSEEWKENVLNNVATRDLHVHLSGDERCHTLTVRALDEGVLFDRFMLFAVPQ